MSRCPQCHRGRLWNEDGRLSCLLCSYVAADPIRPIDRVLSNATPEEDPGSGIRQPGDIAAALDLTTALERVILALDTASASLTTRIENMDDVARNINAGLTWVIRAKGAAHTALALAERESAS